MSAGRRSPCTLPPSGKQRQAGTPARVLRLPPRGHESVKCVIQATARGTGRSDRRGTSPEYLTRRHNGRCAAFHAHAAKREPARRPDRAAAAAAKCSLPVDQKAGFINQSVDGGDRYGGFPEKRAVEVIDLGEGRYEVTGQTVVQADNGLRGADFDCLVSPERRDKLRGFAVTRLQVSPVRSLG